MYENKNIVVFGVSGDASKYGHKIFKTLLAKGLHVFGVNPKGGEVLGQTLFVNLDSLPVRPDVAIMVIPPAALPQAVSQCEQAGVKEIWFQPGAQSAQAYDQAVRAGMEAVESCFMADNGFW